MFANALFDRINTDIQPDIEHTLFEQTDERSLDATSKICGYFYLLMNSLANNIIVQHGVLPEFDLSCHMFAQIE